ncbi:RICIN domain-containing protein [Streptomyces puniciscabiei]
MDLSGSSTGAGTALQLYSYNGTKAQRFHIAATDSAHDLIFVVLEPVVPGEGGAEDLRTVRVRHDQACAGVHRILGRAVVACDEVREPLAPLLCCCHRSAHGQLS